MVVQIQAVVFQSGDCNPEPPILQLKKSIEFSIKKNYIFPFYFANI
jgi:hypothetical protein